MAAAYDIGFISANYVARLDGYGDASLEDWGELEARTRSETGPEHVAAWMETVAAVGFEGVALWTPHRHR